MEPWIYFQCVMLLLAANGAPVLAWRFLGRHLATPLDFGWLLPLDGRPLLGSSKTWRGILASLGLTPLVAMALGLGWQAGLLFAAWAMLGDLISSFVKRRIGLTPSAKAVGIDQIPEALLPLAASRHALGLTWVEVAALVLLFIPLELGLSRILYRLHIRKQPH